MDGSTNTKTDRIGQKANFFKGGPKNNDFLFFSLRLLKLGKSWLDPGYKITKNCCPNPPFPVLVVKTTKVLR